MMDPAKLSPMELVALDPVASAELEAHLAADENLAKALEYDWEQWARPAQRIPSGDWWSIWLLLAGRGFGKTRTLSEFSRWCKERYSRGVLIGRTAADVRDILIEGESGILATSPPWDRPKYEPAKRRLTWGNGSMCVLVSADQPDATRGLQCEWFGADELAAWRYLPEAWANLMLGWRLGVRPLGCIATTPRPLELLRELLARPDVVVSRGSTLENSGNLAPQFRANVVARYAGTRLGRQEIDGEILEQVEGALWTAEMFEGWRLAKLDRNRLARVVVAVDPAASHKPTSDDTGLVVVGRGHDGRGYLLEDATCHLSPAGWGRLAVDLARRWGADAIVAEVNNGGEMVAHTIATVEPFVRVIQVRASRGKAVRAEPIAALYEQGRISHVGEPDAYGSNPYSELEAQAAQMTKNGYVGEGSPDRLDAMVWGFTELFLSEQELTLAGALIEEPGMISPI